jgi:hypothetical protein
METERWNIDIGRSTYGLISRAFAEANVVPHDFALRLLFHKIATCF